MSDAEPDAPLAETESDADELELDGLDDDLRAALRARGFTSLTDVQLEMLRPDLDGRDLLVSARTGSGKTLAFGLRIAKLCRGIPASRGRRAPRALAIAPTRELATQVATELGWFLRAVGLRVLAVTGGTSVGRERESLGMGCDVLVGTPGRLGDHLRSGAFDPSQAAIVVLDEADEMLDMGFREELEAILDRLPPERSTVLFSATLPPPIVQLAARYQKDPVRIAVAGAQGGHADIAYVAHAVPEDRVLDALVNVLLASPDERTLVFARTRADASDVAGSLRELGFDAGALTGEMAQRERSRTLEDFRAGRLQVLVATDVASRGIDVPEVTRVVQLELPHDAEVYVHRAGRTGRAGRKGTSVSIVPRGALGRARRTFASAGVSVEFRPVPGANEIRANAGVRLREALLSMDDESAALHRETARALLQALPADKLVERLIARVGFSGPCEPRDVPEVPLQRPKRMQGADMGDRGPRHELVMFEMNAGSRHGMSPARLVAMVCRRGGIDGPQVGAIRIESVRATFGVHADVAEAFERLASRRDARDPQVWIRPMGFDEAGAGGPPQRARRPMPAGMRPGHPQPPRWRR